MNQEEQLESEHTMSAAVDTYVQEPETHEKFSLARGTADTEKSIQQRIKQVKDKIKDAENKLTKRNTVGQ